MIGEALGARILCAVTVSSEWYECSTKVNEAQTKVRYMTSERETTSPFRIPFAIADTYMNTGVISHETILNTITTRYLHLHDDAKIWKAAKSVSSANLLSLFQIYYMLHAEGGLGLGLGLSGCSTLPRYLFDTSRLD